MSLNKSEISLLTIDKKMSASENILKNKSRFAKTEQIDPRGQKAPGASINKSSIPTDITDTPLAFDHKLDKDISDVSDVLDIGDASDIIDKSTIEILD